MNALAPSTYLAASTPFKIVWHCNRMDINMVQKTLPFTKEQIRKLTEKHPTPFYVYDKGGIIETAQGLNKAFSWVPGGFRNYFAVKACPNPHILEILKKTGFGADCSSLPELEIANMVGMGGRDIMFTSNDTPADEFVRAKELGAIINLDDISHLDFLEARAGGLPDMICFRYNPGSSREGNMIIGKPEEAKYGVPDDQIFEAYCKALSKGVRRFGLHTMIASNELNPQYFVETVEMLLRISDALFKSYGISLEFINSGGGIGIPYRPEQDAVDLELVSNGIKERYGKYGKNRDRTLPQLFMECGRLITGPHGYLVSTVRHVSRKHRNYVGMDACMANLMRPALYDAYHHITVLGKENSPRNFLCDVTGSLCENNDKFAKNRYLPKVEPGDVLVFHDAGAHGHAMGFQYNGKLRCAEFLLTEEGTCVMIRRAEQLSDYLATLDFEGSGLWKLRHRDQ